MKIAYIVNARMPTEKAHGVHIMKMCESLGGLRPDGATAVELIVPRRFNIEQGDPFQYYGVPPTFKISRIPCIDLLPLGFGNIGFKIQALSFFFFTWLYLFGRRYDLIYLREPLAGLICKNFILEIHFVPDQIRRFVVATGAGGAGASDGMVGFFHRLLFMFHRRIWNRSGMIVVTTGFIKEEIGRAGVRADKIAVEPDGVDLAKFDLQIEKQAAREKLGLPHDKKIIMYTGHLYDWKGVQVLAEAAGELGPECLVVFVGGTVQDVDAFIAKNGGRKNIAILGQKPHTDMPLYLKAADVLVLPNSAKSSISKYYTSPLKLFEYMASKVPIVASDLPSIAEILNDQNSVLVLPDDAAALAKGINRVLHAEESGRAIARRAFSDVQKYTWEQRAARIIKLFKKITSLSGV
jgi:glycosyltransferase involved in cell wall biosynthesis